MLLSWFSGTNWPLDNRKRSLFITGTSKSDFSQRLWICIVFWEQHKCALIDPTFIQSIAVQLELFSWNSYLGQYRKLPDHQFTTFSKSLSSLPCKCKQICSATIFWLCLLICPFLRSLKLSLGVPLLKQCLLPLSCTDFAIHTVWQTSLAILQVGQSDHP